jgi:hypothetical protein
LQIGDHAHMPWYAWLYLAALSALVMWAAFDDLRHGDPFLVIIIDLLEGCAYWIFVMFSYQELLPKWSVLVVPIMLIVTAVWTVRRARHAFRRVFARPSELTPDEKRLAVRAATITGIVVIAPAYIAGARLTFRLIGLRGL